MKKRISFLLIVISLVFNNSHAKSEIHSNRKLQLIYFVKSLKCTLGKGTTGLWESGNLKIENDIWNTTVHFDGINLEKGTARIIGNSGSSNVSVIKTNLGITFIEKTSLGNLIFTTVFNSYKKGTNKFHAVSSRHISIMDKPTASQYHGICEIW